MAKERLVPKLRFKFSSDWESKKLKDIIQISKEKYNPDSDKTNYKCIELEHLSQETGLLLGFTDSINQNSIKNKFHKGNILFGKLRPYLKKFYYPNFDGVCSSEIWVFDTNEYSKYIYYLIQGKRFIDISNVSSGSKMPRSDWNFMKDFIFHIPDIKTQKETANLFSVIDNKIELLEKKYQAYEDFKKYLMQQIFAQKLRFADDNGEYYENWKELYLKDIISLKGGYAFKSELFKDEGIPIIRISNISPNNSVVLDDLVYYDKLDNDSDFIIKKGELIIAMSGATTGKVAVYDLEHESYINQRVGLFKKTSSELYYPFLVQYTLSDSFKRELQKTLVAGAQPNISKKEIESFSIKLPQYEEQKKIANLLSNIDLKINTIKNQNLEINMFKRSLLQQMFV